MNISLTEAQREMLADALRDTSQVGCRDIADDLAPVVAAIIEQYLPLAGREKTWHVETYTVAEPSAWTDLPNGMSVWNGGTSARMVRTERNYVIIPPRDSEWRVA